MKELVGQVQCLPRKEKGHKAVGFHPDPRCRIGNAVGSNWRAGKALCLYPLKLLEAFLAGSCLCALSTVRKT